MSEIKVRILTPLGEVYSKKAELVNFRTVEGAMGVLPKRAPLIVHLSIHEMEMVTAEKRDRIHVAGGYLYCDGEEVVVVTTDARRE